MSIKVSIIVPVYNTFDYLRRCLDSLVGQTLESIEIIVVNDGSPDNSQVIIEEYASLYPNTVKGYIKSNGGLSDARNYGVEKASGEYLAFVDSDDYVEKDFCERMYQRAKETGSDVVTSPPAFVFEDHVETRPYSKIRFGKNVREDGYILERANSFACNKIYRTSFWKENGFLFPVQRYEDSALIYNVMLLANKVSCVNIAFYYYIKDRESSIINTADKRIYDIFKSTDSIISFYKEHNAFEELYETVEYICIRHIFARIDMLHRSMPSDFNKEFVSFAIKYLDRNFVNWRKSEFLRDDKSKKTMKRIYRFYGRHDYLLKRYASGKRILYDRLEEYRDKRKNKEPAKKQSGSIITNIQKYGLWMIHDVQRIMSVIGVDGFADSDTCLGIVRETGLPKNATSIDIGAITDDSEKTEIRIAMERSGYRLCKQYICNGSIIGESYSLRGMTVDLSYYTENDEHTIVRLFYRNPEVEYSGNTGHVVEMTYSPIKEIRRVCIDGVEFNIPENAETLMEEQYGPEYMSSDAGCTCWESPAAKRLEEKGHYITYTSYKLAHRSREVPTPALIDNDSDGNVNWNKAIECAEKGYDPIVIGSKEDEKTNRHPRIQVYVGDSSDTEFMEMIRYKEYGEDPIISYSDIEDVQ